MGKATEVLERMEHAAHAGGNGHDHGQTALGDRFPTLVGISMAILGVLLAFASAKVGGERTELVKTLVEQQHAHAKYQAQDIKHRTAVIGLRQIHSTLEPQALEHFESQLNDIEKAALAEVQNAPGAAVGVTTGIRSARLVGQSLLERFSPKREDMLLLTRTVERYLAESDAAKEWVESFDPIVTAHLEGQEYYELAQLAAEIGIVLASIALLLRTRILWGAAVLLGVLSLGTIGVTYRHVSHEVHGAEIESQELGKAYRELRNAGKTTGVDQALVDEVLAMYGAVPAATAPSREKTAATHESGAKSH